MKKLNILERVTVKTYISQPSGKRLPSFFRKWLKGLIRREKSKLTREELDELLFKSNVKGTLIKIITIDYKEEFYLYEGEDSIEKAMNYFYDIKQSKHIKTYTFVNLSGNPLNPMCKGCSNLFKDCQGSTEMVWTGCVYRNKKI